MPAAAVVGAAIRADGVRDGEFERARREGDVDPRAAVAVTRGVRERLLEDAAGPGTDLKLFATGPGAGILLDATVIRALIVPPSSR